MESLPLRSSLRPGPVQAALVVTGAGLALTLGLASGHPTPAVLAAAVALVVAVFAGVALARPFAALLALTASTALLLVYDLPSGLGINLFDLLLPCLIVSSVLGGAIEAERQAVRRATDSRSQELHRAARRLAKAVIVFYAIAALSIVAMAFAGRTAPLANSTFTLLRGLQGLLLFPLAIWWIRSERQIHTVFRVMLVGTALLAVLNTAGFALDATKRAGMIWFVNQSEAPIGGPNETASTMLMMLTILAVRQSCAQRFHNLAWIGLVLALLVATFSRSGLLASLAFTAFVMPKVKLRWVALAVVTIAAAIPIIPEDYWTRLGRTLVLERGTFEAFTSLIRIYGWKTAWAVFLDNPVLGVGYVAYPYVSDAYGELRIRGNPVDNYYLETAAGMGLVGVVALGVVIARLFQVGTIVRRLAPVGTLGHAMSRFHTPLLVGLLIVNLTGNNFVGMVVLGQLALWCAMLVRAGHLAIEPKGS